MGLLTHGHQSSARSAWYAAQPGNHCLTNSWASEILTPEMHLGTGEDLGTSAVGAAMEGDWREGTWSWGWHLVVSAPAFCQQHCLTLLRAR